MFDVGWPELLVILAVALLFFGPQRMVELARTVGKALREFRTITNEFTGTFTDILKEEAPPPARPVTEPASATKAQEPPIIAGPLTIPPPAHVPPDEYDPADLSMPPFPDEPEPLDEPGLAPPPTEAAPED